MKSSDKKVIGTTGRSPVFARYLWCLLLASVVVASSIAQQTAPAASATAPAQRPQSPGFAAQALTANASDDTAAIMALQMKVEDATIRQNTAYVDSVTSPDFTMVHGDHWATGGRAQLADDKAAYLKRVTDQFYLVHDIDPNSIHFEMHKDIAICYGRYLSVTKPPATSKNPGSITSIWFERVFQKRNGQWVYLSHRTVHGPDPSPAGIDPTALPWDGGPDSAKIPATVGNPIAGGNGGVPEDKDPTISKSPEAADVMAFEKSMEAAVVRGDTAAVSSDLADDFIMVHGDGWIRGGKAALADNKESFLKRVTSKQYLARDLDSVKVEMHGDVAITYGRYIAQNSTGNPAMSWFSVWFERVYEKQNGKWMYVSHRTVHGPTYGPTRDSVSDK